MTKNRRSIIAQLVAPCSALALLASACGGDGLCPSLPCPFLMAIRINITSSASSGPVPGMFVHLTQGRGSVNCSESPGIECDVSGGAGSYQMDIGGTGFQTVHRTVSVNGNTVKCGCSSVETQQLNVALVPSP